MPLEIFPRQIFSLGRSVYNCRILSAGSIFPTHLNCPANSCNSSGLRCSVAPVKTLWKICGIRRLLAIVIAVVLIYTYKFGGATSWILQARAAARKDPTLANVPVRLGDRSVSLAPGTTFSEFGYQFEVPWPAKLKTQDDFAALIYVPEGQLAAVRFVNPAEALGLVKETREMLEKRGENPKAANLFLDAASD